MNEYNIDIEEPPTHKFHSSCSLRQILHLCDIPSVRAVYRRFTFEDCASFGFGVVPFGCQ